MTLVLSALAVLAPCLFGEADWLDLYLSGSRRLENGEFEPARADLEAALVLLPHHPATEYQLACAHVRSGARESALRILGEAIADGFADADVARWDPDLAPLREDPQFRHLLEPLPAAVRSKDSGKKIIWDSSSIVASISRDESIVVSGRGSCSTIWDARTHALIAALERPREHGSWLAVSPDARFVAFTGEAERSNAAFVRIHDALTGDLVRELPEASGWQAHAEFSNDSRRLFIHGGAPIHTGTVWNTETWELSSAAPVAFEQAVCGPDGKFVLLVSRRANERSEVVLWSVDSGAIAARHDGLFGTPNLEIAFSADGSKIAVHDHPPKEIVVLDGRTGAIATRIPTETEVAGLAFGASSDDLYAAERTGDVLQFDVRTGKDVRRIELGLTEPAWPLLRNAGDRLLLSGSYPLGVVDLSGGKLKWLRGDQASFNWGASWSPSEMTVVVGGVDGVELVDPETGRVRDQFRGPGLSTRVVAASGSDSVWIECSDASLREVDRRTGRTRRVLDGGSTEPLGFALSPDGIQIALLDADRTLRVFSARDGKEKARVERAAKTPSGWCRPEIRFSADGAACAVADTAGGLQVFETKTWTSACAFDALEQNCRAFALAPDGGRVALGDHNGFVELRAVKGGGAAAPALQVDGAIECLAFETAHARLWIGTNKSQVFVYAGSVLELVIDLADLDTFDTVEIGSITFSPDGTTAIIASSGFGVVCACDTTTGKRKWNYEYSGGNPSPLWSRFFADGKLIYVWGQGPWSPRVVDAATGALVQDLASFDIGDIVAAGDARVPVVASAQGLRWMDFEHGHALLSRLEFEHAGWILAAPSGHVDGSRDALDAAHLQLETRSLALDALASRIVDVKKVAASAAGVAVHAVRYGEPPSLSWSRPHARVERVSGDAAEIELSARADSTSGVVAFELLMDGVRTRLSAVKSSADARDAQCTFEIPRPARTHATEVRLRAIGADGLMSRALRIAIETEP